ncbi:hypothetical protein GCM10010912_40240 [Paenibacillus albidus]|uniref:Aminotransferase class V domain-containing protein n=2 Tax=Paenibacillus albidus TaxID=2041023 RepID=A0A917CLG3_9BACL|nr:hypothetical protein GCM10010912_40240 [Paenibacillus albidus]
MYAPKGIGALYTKKGIHLEPLIHGASHERGRRAGTENVMFAVALGTACKLASAMDIEQTRELTRYFYTRLKAAYGDIIKLNGHPEKRLPNTLNISFIGSNGHDILDALDHVAASTGSACHSGLSSVSPVLKAMGVNDSVGQGAIRFSLGRYTTPDEIEEVLKRLSQIIPVVQ